MKYSGTLYGKIERKYIPLVMDSDDVDKLETKVETLEAEKAHTDILIAKVREYVDATESTFVPSGVCWRDVFQYNLGFIKEAQDDE